MSRLCRVLAVLRSGYCQWRARPPSVRAQANQALDAEVAAIYRASRGSYGRPRIVRQLRAQGRPASAERVRRSLQRQGLRPVYKRPYRVTTDSTHHLPVAPNLLDRRFDGWQLNQAWVSDITFIATDEGWLFLAAPRSGKPAYRRLVDVGANQRGSGLPGPVSNFVFKAYDAPKETICLANRKPNR